LIFQLCKNALMIDWQDLNHLVMLGRLGSLAAAAKALRVDHATVSRRIAGLEKSVGLKLVVRLPKSCRLTEDGDALVAIAAQMEDVADAVGRYVRRKAVPFSGTVTVSALPALASAVIAPSLPRLREQHRGIKVVLSATSTVVSLAKGEADITIGFLRPKTPASIVRRIGILKLGLYGTAAMASRPATEWLFVGFEETLNHIPQQVWLSKFAGDREFVLRSNDVATQQAAAGAGLGLAVLPSLVADQDSRLSKIVVDDGPKPRELWLSVHADLRKSPAVRATMDHLISIFESRAG
jgi:DNA-binding transcriptional LysR family regulator